MLSDCVQGRCVWQVEFLMELSQRSHDLSSESIPSSVVPELSKVQWWLFGGLIFIAAFVVHLTALPGGFFWDDYDWVVRNPRVRNADGLYHLWFDINQYDYWPMHYSTHWFEWRVWGEWAPPYRVLNQLMHGLNCVLLWFILRWLGIPGAWLCAMIFAVHPVNVESVVWISQRKTVQSTGFVFGSLLCLFQFYDTKRKRWYALSLVLFILGLLTKSSVVMWPLAAMVCIWWRQRRLRWQDLWYSAPFLAISFALGLTGTLMRGEQLGIEFARDDGFLSRLAMSANVVWFYVAETLWPFQLSVVYPRWELGNTQPSAFIPLLILVLTVAVFWWYRRGWGAAPLGASSYYLINIFPVMGFVPIMYMRYSLVADHWQYLAMPGLLALIVGLATWQWRKYPAFHLVGPAVSCAIVLLLAYNSLSQAAIWSGTDNEPIWRDVLSKNPNSELAHLRLGYVLARRGKFAEAVPQICEAMKFSVPPVPWGPPEIDERRLAMATAHPYELLGLEDTADNVRVAYALGTAMYVMGQYNTAGAYLNSCTAEAPQFAAGHYNFALALEQLGYSDQAKEFQLKANSLLQMDKASSD